MRSLASGFSIICLVASALALAFISAAEVAKMASKRTAAKPTARRVPIRRCDRKFMINSDAIRRNSEGFAGFQYAPVALPECVFGGVQRSFVAITEQSKGGGLGKI